MRGHILYDTDATRPFKILKLDDLFDIGFGPSYN